MTALQDPPAPVAPPPPAPPARSPRPRPQTRWRFAERLGTGWTARTALLWLAAVTVLFGLDVVFVTSLQYHAAQHDRFAQLRETLAEGTTPVNQVDDSGALIPVGTPVAMLDIPAAGVHHVVVGEGTSGQTLEDGPGHQRSTVFPGQRGVSIIQGRAASYGGPFAHLDRLRPGDTVTVTTGQAVSRFVVKAVRRAGDPTTAVTATTARVTFVTATGLPFMPTGVLRVDADLVGDPLDPGIIRAVDLPPAEAPMGTMPDTLPVTILCLQGLLVVVLGAVWAWQRYGPVRTWLAAGPVVVLAVVLVTSRVTLLLPNLL